MRLAVIPARGGSKRIPRKNVLDFCGRPMIAWSIGAAIASGSFDRITVSTDDAEIAAIAEAAGAEVPFMRPAHLSDDHTGTMPVIAHAIDWHRASGLEPRDVCCLYATAPFMTAEDIRAGLALLDDPTVDFAFPVTRYPFPIQRAIRIRADGRAEMFDPSAFTRRSQDLEEAFHDAGQFYWGRAEAWLAGRPLFSPAARPLVISRERVEDIDTPEDWRRAELLFRALGRAP